MIPKFSQACIDLAKQYEKCVLVPYDDKQPWVTLSIGQPVKGTLTCGWGHTGPDVVIGEVWTQERADTTFEQDVNRAWQQLNALVTVDLTQGQVDALTDWVFNEGSGHLQQSTLLQILNRGEYELVPEQIMRWNIFDGKVNDGLEKRREQEVELWNS